MLVIRSLVCLYQNSVPSDILFRQGCTQIKIIVKHENTAKSVLIISLQTELPKSLRKLQFLEQFGISLQLSLNCILTVFYNS